MLSSMLAQDKAWQEAVEVTRAGLQLAPDDVMLTNNAAYFLATGLNNGAEAVPLAEKAAAAAPRQGGIQETLAAAYWAAGEKAKAFEAMSWTIRLGEWRLDAGDRPGAERVMRIVRDGLIDAPAAADQIKEPLEAFRKRLGAS
jgi:hypothetical protein